MVYFCDEIVYHFSVVIKQLTNIMMIQKMILERMTMNFFPKLLDIGISSVIGIN